MAVQRTMLTDLGNHQMLLICVLSHPQRSLLALYLKKRKSSTKCFSKKDPPFLHFAQTPVASTGL